MNIAIIGGHDIGYLTTAIHNTNRSTTIINQIPEPEKPIKLNYMKGYTDEMYDRLQNSLFNKMLQSGSVYAPRLKNQRQKRKQWKQNPHSRPLNNRR